MMDDNNSDIVVDNVNQQNNPTDFIMLREGENVTDENSSKLKLYNPNIMLTGHKGEIYTGKFSNEGYLYGTAGHDRSIMLWEVFEETCRNITTLQGHTNAVLDIKWSQDDSKLFSCSADKTVSIWDIYEAKRIKKLKGHDSFVTSLDATKRGPELVVSGGEDSQMIIWDLRNKTPSVMEKFKYQITAVSFSFNGEQVFIGGIDNQIKIYNLNKRQVENTLIGHTDTITSLALSNDGNFLLSNSMDNTIRCWDVRPYAKGSRCIKQFTGATHNFEKNLLKVAWSPDDSLISAGSADRFVYIWNFSTTNIERKFGGHNGSVNETSFNKLSNVIASVSSDQTAILGEY